MSFRDYIESGPPLLTNTATGAESRIKGTFVLENTSSTVANTLRRAIHVNTRSVGFSADLTRRSDTGIEVRRCTSNLFNEMLAHRLSMLPLGVINIDTFIPANYECILKVKNDSTEVRHVRASDFVIREKQSDGSFEIVDTFTMFPPDPITGETSLLVTLMPQRGGKAFEEVDLTIFPVVSTGKSHIEFSPVCQPAFGNTPDLNPVRREAFLATWLSENKKLSDTSILTKTALAGFIDEWSRLNPTSAGAGTGAGIDGTNPMFIAWLATKPIQDIGALEPNALESYTREWMTMAAQKCFQIDPITGQANSFTFKIESVGIRSIPDIVAEAIRAIIELVTPFADESTSSEELNLEIIAVDGRMNGVNVFITNQDHTLGNLLQTIITEMFLDSGEPDAIITSVAYKVPHPLEPILQLQIGIPLSFKGNSANLARHVIALAAKQAQELFDKLGKNWDEVSKQVTRTPFDSRRHKKPTHQFFEEQQQQQRPGGGVSERKGPE